MSSVVIGAQGAGDRRWYGASRGKARFESVNASVEGLR
jgi:hypothetical protein